MTLWSMRRRTRSVNLTRHPPAGNDPDLKSHLCYRNWCDSLKLFHWWGKMWRTNCNTAKLKRPWICWRNYTSTWNSLSFTLRRCIGPVHWINYPYSLSAIVQHFQFIYLEVASWLVCSLPHRAVGVPVSPGQGHWAVFLGKTLYSHSAFFHPGLWVILRWTGIPSRGSRNNPGRFMLHISAGLMATWLKCRLYLLKMLVFYLLFPGRIHEMSKH